MSADQVAVVPEARRVRRPIASADEERWQLREVDLDEFAWYCRSCAEREFGEA